VKAGRGVARALIVGCGCRGRSLGERLLARGWQVRGTSRREEGLEAIAAAGIEPALADPARLDTLLDQVGGVTVVAWILGSAQGGDEELAALHGPRLDRLVEKLVETPVRGFVYEAAGSVDPILLARGQESLEAAADRWQIPLSTLFVDPSDHDVWADPIEIWLDAAEHLVLDLAGQTP
jgi:nucleoside-diphosphate-sugar epimerase